MYVSDDLGCFMMITASTIKGGVRFGTLLKGMLAMLRKRPSQNHIQFLVQIGTWVRISPLQTEPLMPHEREVPNKTSPLANQISWCFHQSKTSAVLQRKNNAIFRV